MNSNSLSVIDREIASPQIEGVDFGGKLWIIARSPVAVLAWVYGSSASINGHQRYYQPHLLILPDRTANFMSRPKYRSLRHSWTRLTPVRIRDFRNEIISTFGDTLGLWEMISKAVAERKTVLIEGGGGKLMPHPKLWGHAYSDWINNPENGFLVREEVNKGLRHKLGYKGELV